MSSVEVHSGQSFFNLVVETTGSIDNAFNFMLENNRTSLTTFPIVGSKVKFSGEIESDVVDFYVSTQKPATLKAERTIQAFDYYLPGEIPYNL